MKILIKESQLVKLIADYISTRLSDAKIITKPYMAYDVRLMSRSESIVLYSTLDGMTILSSTSECSRLLMEIINIFSVPHIKAELAIIRWGKNYIKAHLK